MSTAVVAIEPLVAGDHLTFTRRSVSTGRLA